MLQDVTNTDCVSYDNDVPTFSVIIRNAPPEYFPLLGIGFICLVGNSVFTFLEVRKHSVYIEGRATFAALRNIMMLLCFWLFPMCSFIGMVSLRSSQFVHFIANTYEALCILAFHENMCSHLEVRGFFSGKGGLASNVPPCCCFCPCLPPFPRTPQTIRRLRAFIVQMVVLQTTVGIARVIKVFECTFDPDSISVYVMDAIVLTSFMIAMWALIVVFKSGREELRDFNYPVKFACFKGMIFVSKILYSVLNFIASQKLIHGYAKDGIQIIDGKRRSSIWCNFITILASTLLLVLSYRFYNRKDYAPFLHEGFHGNVTSEKTSSIALDENINNGNDTDNCKVADDGEPESEKQYRAGVKKPVNSRLKDDGRI